MTKAEKTRQFIIERSAILFNTKGYENTSLSDIQEATKLTKGAIYGNFSDKNELAQATYIYNSSQVINRIKVLMYNAPTAKDAILANANFYFNNYKVLFERGGCPMLNAAVEADDHLHYLKDSVRHSMNEVITLIQNTIVRGQRNKEFSLQINAEDYAMIIFSIIEGSILLSKLMNNPRHLALAADQIHKILVNELLL